MCQKNISMKKLILFLPICFWAVGVLAQHELEWQRAYGGTRDDEGHAISPCATGGHFVAGISQSNNFDVASHYGVLDCWIMKINDAGDILWQRTLGGSNNEQVSYMEGTADGGCIVAASSKSYNGELSGIPTNTDSGWLFKLSADGQVEWQRTFYDVKYPSATTIRQTSDGGYIAALQFNTFSATGAVTYVFRMLKLDSHGETLWMKDTEERYCTTLFQTSDGGYFAAGIKIYRMANGSIAQDFWSAKLDPTGAVIWEKILGGSDNDQAYCAAPTSDGGFIVGGSTYSYDGDVSGNHGLVDCWVIKFTASGTIEWQNNFGGQYWEETRSIMQTGDGGYIILAETGSIEGDVSFNWGGISFWLVKLDQWGLIEWEGVYGGTLDDNAFGGYPTSDGGYIMVGATKSLNGDVLDNHGLKDLWLAKISDVH